MRKLALLVAVAALAGCGSSKDDVPAVAHVGGQTVTVAQYDALLKSARRYYAEQKKPFPPRGTAAYRKLRDQVVKRLVQGAIFVDAAGDRVADIDVDNAIETLKQEQYRGSDDQLQQALNAAGLTRAELRREERVQLSEAAVQNAVIAKVKIGDAQARAYYASHRGDYRRPASRPVRHILVKTKPLADKLYARLRNGASFEKLMHRYSTDTASKRGTGKMIDRRGLFVPPFEKVAFALRTAQISKPVRTEFGWHIIQALGPVDPGGPKPFAEVKGSIEAILLPPKQQRALKKSTDSLYARYCNGKISYETGWSSSFCANR